MKTLVRLAILFAGVLAALPALAAPLGTAFTYQGQLTKNGLPYDGTADFGFKLYDALTGGNPVGSVVSLTNVPVTDGLFTVELDFGPVFTGQALWLDIGVMTPGEQLSTSLAPRQAITAVPYALHALSAPGGGGGGSQWSDHVNGVYHGGNVGIGTTPRNDVRLWLNVAGGVDQHGLYVSSASASHAAFFMRNSGANGWGLYDDTSPRHFLAGSLGIGAAPSVPLEIVNPNFAGARIVAYGNSNIPTPGEGVRAALFVKGLTGTGFGGASSGAIYAASTDARAVSGWTTTGWGVDGNNTSSGCYGVLGTPNEGVFGYSSNVSLPAGKFVAPTNGVALEAYGIAKVKTLQILGGADLAEPFDVAAAHDQAAAPGTVVVIDEASPGGMRVSDRAYDTRVAGVISGANGLQPGMVMKAEGDAHADGEHPVALTGRVWTRVDAGFGAVRPGDLLTTSPTAGHAMRADDAARRSGAVIGKAMTSLEDGRGLVLVLVSLQ